MNKQNYQNAALELKQFRAEMYFHSNPLPDPITRNGDFGDYLLEAKRSAELIRIHIGFLTVNPLQAILKALFEIIYIVLVVMEIIKALNEEVEYLKRRGIWPESYRRLYLDPNPQLLIENL